MRHLDLKRGYWGQGTVRLPVYSREYYSQNSGVNRKHPSVVGAPSASWHLAFWMPPDRSANPGRDGIPGSKTIPFNQHRAEWLKDVDWYLANLARTAWKLWGPADSPDKLGTQPTTSSHIPAQETNPGSTPLFRYNATNLYHSDPRNIGFSEIISVDDYRYETFSLKMYFDGIPVKIRANLHSEYFTLTCTAEFNRFSEIPGDGSVLRSVSHAFNDLRKVSGERWAEIRSRTGTKGHSTEEVSDTYSKHETNYQAASGYFFDGFWDEFRKRLIEPAFWPDFPRPDHSKPAAADHTSIPPIGESIGTVFADFRGLLLAIDATDSSLSVHSPFSEIDRSAETTGGTVTLPNQLSRDLVSTFLPFMDAGNMKSANRSDLTSRRASSEYTASRILNRRAIYFSSLGAQKNSIGALAEKVEIPVTYLVITPHHERWQIGRLIERLHTLGTLRLASLRDLSEINTASSELRDLGAEAKSFEQRYSSGFHTSYVSDLGKLYDVFERVGIRCEGGLLYRIERSRYYVSSFLTLVSDLRISRIEGFQTYDEFIRRRIGATWDSISRVGARFQRVRDHLDSLSTQAQTGIQVQQLKQHTDLLSFAEKAATIPIMYYGGHILEAGEEGLSELARHFSPQLAVFPPPPLALWMAVAGLLYGAWAYFRHRKNDNSAITAGAMELL